MRLPFGRGADLDRIETMGMVDAWHRACEGAGLYRSVATVTGETRVIPKVLAAEPSRSRLIVRLEPGMTAGDLRAASPRIAPFVGAWGLRVEPYGHGENVIVHLLAGDPLGTRALPCPDRGPILVGRDEHGEHLGVVDPAELTHICVQGQTRSGKSVFLYSLLSALDRQRRHGYPLRIDGVDPSGLLLRPFIGSVLGLGDPDAVEDYLTSAVRELDSRISRIPLTSDVLPVSDDDPLRFIVIEELPGLWRHLDAVDPKQAKRCRALLARLLSESHKAGMRVVILCQRAEATTIGASERAQCAMRVSFRSDTREGVKLLHADVDGDTADRHTREAAGIALLSVPGRALTRVRTPFLPYADYVRRVSQ
ncbi:hypothetical protein [Pseudonocardia oroxyli]|uniref:DNA segregation ATPase FtsK/SpoIIIE, S-DNA-T family n=1 Tax=Pseudonocardia oroxyli TaxID=366584 RepID=A0A1G7UNE7_PSEOR|nr:hypothetical protein [Pseudonocardia oroxyli]SDG48639.1 DNA segregation ATPase FtsK/SpoIIIE, S-DNA-T family [Pseudonocardia oroxyli]